MTTYYSDHYGPAVGATGHFTTRRTPGAPALDPTMSHGRRRKSQARVTVPAAKDFGAGEIIRLFDLRSGDRLLDLRICCDANFGLVATWDVGLYKKGLVDDGAVIDADLFAAALDLVDAVARTDVFTQATTLTDMDRGKPLWYLADKGAGTYSADPFEIWTVAMTSTADLTVVDGAVEIVVEADYFSGD